ncbi:ribosomal protein S18-alanine N-acetyltransferase [uncultured Methanoregula sp.]|uniref:ribosomal protein S18-alanine N-acetyltransferase n=1 Tax=uncultured Methanoregula sp. TaxID=1005933 RepID=UPI003747D5B0
MLCLSAAHDYYTRESAGDIPVIRSHDLAPYPLPLIRRAVPADIAAIVSIEKESFVDPWEQSAFLEALSYYPTTYFVAVADGVVTGFVIGGIEDTGENIYGHLCNIGVIPRYRSKGIGRLLVRRLEHQFALEMATGVQLEVRVSNTAAQRFYQRMGYRNVFGIENYYANGEDALVMMKWFRF